MNGEPCLCGAPDCRFCFPSSYEEFKRRAAHEDHEGEIEDCVECSLIEDDWDLKMEERAERRRERMMEYWDD